MDHYKFWMVFAEGGQAPNKQHFVEADAVSEAHRLAKKNGRPAYVLESMMGYEVPEPLVVKFATSEAQPLPPNVLADRPAALHAGRVHPACARPLD
jgi:hypothetical protein